MPLDRLMLILVIVIGGAAVTVWAAALIFGSAQVGPFAVVPVLSLLGLGAYIAWRVVSERLNNPDEDHYDNMEN